MKYLCNILDNRQYRMSTKLIIFILLIIIILFLAFNVTSCDKSNFDVDPMITQPMIYNSS